MHECPTSGAERTISTRRTNDEDGPSTSAWDRRVAKCRSLLLGSAQEAVRDAYVREAAAYVESPGVNQTAIETCIDADTAIDLYTAVEGTAVNAGVCETAVDEARVQRSSVDDS